MLNKVPLYEHTWNRTTLQQLKVDRGLTYLQCLYPHDRIADAVAEVGAEVRGRGGAASRISPHQRRHTASGIPVIRYTTPERLHEDSSRATRPAAS